MILRHQCSRLLSRTSSKTPLTYSSPCSHLLNRRRTLHSTSVRRAEPPIEDDADEGIIDNEDLDLDLDAPPSDPEDLRTLVSNATGKEFRSQRGRSDVPDRRRGDKQTLFEIDQNMSVEELGLKSVARRQRREFIRWLKQEGQRYEHFPQGILMSIEERRIEKARKGSEDRMFARMNAFYHSLTMDQLLGRDPAVENETKDEPSSEVSVEETNLETSEDIGEQSKFSPFDQLIRDREGGLHPKVLESRALMLMAKHDPELHKLYRNYINWCDYQLQKRTIWFEFSKRPDVEDLLDRINPEAESSPGKRDLAYYYGPRMRSDAEFPILPKGHSNYVRFQGKVPFSSNSAFKPSRPLPHSKRLQMFDAWREGLGLRNVAWLGGVSWRRVDGIIGILKREWQFVKEGGKLEHDLAEHMEALLAETPLNYDHFPELPALRQMNILRFPSGTEPQPRDPKEGKSVDHTPNADMSNDDIPLADAKMIEVPGERKMVERTAPIPGEDIFIQPQVSMVNALSYQADPTSDSPTDAQTNNQMHYQEYVDYIGLRDKITRYWESSQKEPLVEIPIKRTKQYFAIIQEMEEYSEKRAAKALDGVDGRTMTEKEDGIKMFERFFGGLRSLGEREKFQGTPPWAREISELERKVIQKKAKKARLQPATANNSDTITSSSLTPADAFRLSNATNLTMVPAAKVEVPKERVVWRFEDVSWVKQRTTRPRKQSYAGTLTRRVQLESGVQRYGPFGIGSGIEGVGGVKQVIERGKDGNLRLGPAGREKPKVKREVIV